MPRRVQCSDCDRYLGQYTCDECRAARQRLHLLHLLYRRQECAADRDEQARRERVERYEAMVAAGQRLFEGAPA